MDQHAGLVCLAQKMANHIQLCIVQGHGNIRQLLLRNHFLAGDWTAFCYAEHENIVEVFFKIAFRLIETFAVVSQEG